MSAEPMESAPSYQHYHLERILFDQARIRERVAEMGAQISKEYAGDGLTIVAVLQGGALFMADLIREIQLPLQLESISVASYHGGTSSSGAVTFHQSRLPEVEGSDVLILDDILDTGRTMAAIEGKLEKECSPKSVKSAVLLSKNIERAVEFEADYVGFEVGDEFVVGYGLDYRGHYRNLPVIGVLKPEYISDNNFTMIRVLFFSVLRDLTGSDQIDVPLAQEGGTVADVIQWIYKQHPSVEEWDSKLLIAVNGEFAERSDCLNEGDELALMPPVQGG